MSEELKAGRELDARVAEKAMGWTAVRRDGDRIPGFLDYRGAPGDVKIDPALPLLYWVPHYSTNIAAAWQVVDHFTAQGRAIALEYLIDQGTGLGMWWVVIAGCADAAVSEGSAEDYAQSLPLAICLAALKAVEGGQS